jgi:hypothetical protein
MRIDRRDGQADIPVRYTVWLRASEGPGESSTWGATLEPTDVTGEWAFSTMDLADPGVRLTLADGRSGRLVPRSTTLESMIAAGSGRLG